MPQHQRREDLVAAIRTARLLNLGPEAMGELIVASGRILETMELIEEQEFGYEFLCRLLARGILAVDQPTTWQQALDRLGIAPEVLLMECHDQPDGPSLKNALEALPGWKGVTLRAQTDLPLQVSFPPPCCPSRSGCHSPLPAKPAPVGRADRGRGQPVHNRLCKSHVDGRRQWQCGLDAAARVADLRSVLLSNPRSVLLQLISSWLKALQFARNQAWRVPDLLIEIAQAGLNPGLFEECTESMAPAESVGFQNDVLAGRAPVRSLSELELRLPEIAAIADAYEESLRAWREPDGIAPGM